MGASVSEDDTTNDDSGYSCDVRQAVDTLVAGTGCGHASALRFLTESAGMSDRSLDEFARMTIEHLHNAGLWRQSRRLLD